MQLLATALKARYDSTAGADLRGLLKATATVPQFWIGAAPAGVGLPFIRVNILPMNTSHSVMGVGYLEDVTVQFSIFVDEYGIKSGWDIRDKVCVLFDNYLPTFGTGGASGGVKLCVRTTSGRLIDETPGYQIAVEYHYVFREVLT